MITESLRKVIEDAGLGPDHTNLGQFLEALQAQGLGGYADAAEAQALSSLTKLLTPGRLADAFKGGNQSLVRSAGHQILPGGLILQWRQVPLGFGEGSESHSNPIAFPNGALAAFAIKDPVSATLSNTPRVSITPGQASFVIGIVNGATAGNQMTVILIGH
ncbi:hypothetical protein HOP54_02470 [Halomonas daqingensis]|uniref:gp53-like domain-containing protein n=1 Tax=Billgrantia desiderata TaxID=52021 RepID=UPI001F3F4FD0|nr:hypothetical protein [Halomonas desiderata]MCE8027554.1 hypothetical protein [Halomonas desiderata]